MERVWPAGNLLGYGRLTTRIGHARRALIREKANSKPERDAENQSYFGRTGQHINS